MALTVSSGIPSTIVKGDAISFSVNNADFPVDTWTTATIYFKHGTDAIRNFAGVVTGADHVFTLSNANSDTLFAGSNLVSVSWSDGTYRGSSEWTETSVLENPTAAGTATNAETIVAAIETAMASLVAKKTASVSVDGVSYTWRDLPSLREQHLYWKAQVLKEQLAADAARGIRPGRLITQFT